MSKDARFSSQSENWGTPPELFRALDEVYDFQLDAAASAANHLCPTYFSKKDNALKMEWSAYRRVWLNPPYGRGIENWMRKAYEESRLGCLVVCLVPARVDTRWWHDWVAGKARVTFLKGRLRFIRYSDNSGARADAAPFPSALVIYEPDLDRRSEFVMPPLERKCFLPELCFG